MPSKAKFAGITFEAAILAGTAGGTYAGQKLAPDQGGDSGKYQMGAAGGVAGGVIAGSAVVAGVGYGVWNGKFRKRTAEQKIADNIQKEERAASQKRAAAIRAKRVTWQELSGKSGLSEAKDAVKSTGAYFGKEIGRGLTSKTGAFMGAGAAIGAVVGASQSDDKAAGAFKGAAYGAGAGLVARGGYAAFQAGRRMNKSFIGKQTMHAGILGAAVLGSMVGAAALHAMSAEAPVTGSYSSNGDAGDTVYSDSPIKRRSAAMNATGDVTLGLHNKRHG